jgi:hypothetical protein
VTRVSERTAEPPSGDAAPSERMEESRPAAQLDEAAGEKLKALGYSSGGIDEAPPVANKHEQPAQDSFAATPPPAVTKEREGRAADASPRPDSTMQPPAAAAPVKPEAKRSAEPASEARPPAPPPVAELSRENDTMAAAAEPEAAGSAASEALSAPCMDDGVESPPDPPAPEICPFQFRANFSADATCEAMSKHLRRPCRVDGDQINMRLEPPVAIADGALVERIVVELEGGQALRMRMQLAGGGERVCPSPKPAR